MMDAISNDDIETVVLMTSAQIGKTEILLNALSYFIDQDPSPLLFLQPTLELADAFSKDRLSPCIRDTPALTAKVKDPKARDSGNSIRHKKFAGGHVTMAGSNSPSSLSSRPVRAILADEIDRWPASAGTEGDPLTLARKRTANFPNRKIVATSTPTIKSLSKIESLFNASDQRYFLVPCPRCGHKDSLRWSNIKWDSEEVDGQKSHYPETARYICSSCKAEIAHGEKFRMLELGEWQSTAIGDGKTAGFHINALYSPWTSWQECIEAFLEAKHEGTESLKAWTNTYLGETWEEAGDELDDMPLLQRREEYAAQVPRQVLCITCGVDVQDDRVELEYVGWGQGEQSHGLGVRVIYGDLAQDIIWQDLDAALNETFVREDNHKLKVACTCIDSGGHYTGRVYDYCRRRQALRIYAIKGRGGEGYPVVSAPSMQKSSSDRHGVQLFMLGVDELKARLYSYLRLEEPGPGYCHFPQSHEYGLEFFSQITAEKRVTRFVRGMKKREWVKVRTRNEALDRRVYAMAALYILNPHWGILKKSQVAQPDNKQQRPKQRRPKYSATKW